jgi:hypothetical protein
LKASNKAIEDNMQIITMPEIGFINLGTRIQDVANKNMVLVPTSYNNILGMNGFTYIDLSIVTVNSTTISYKLAHWFTEVDTNRCIEFTSCCANMDYNLGEVYIIPVDKSALNSPELYSNELKGKVLMISEVRQGTLKLIDFAKSVRCWSYSTQYII